MQENLTLLYVNSKVSNLPAQAMHQSIFYSLPRMYNSPTSSCKILLLSKNEHVGKLDKSG